MKTLREYIDQLDEISRRDFLKGAAGAATLLTLPSLSMAGDRNKTIEFMVSIAGTLWDFRKLGYSRSAAMEQIEKRMGIQGEALRVAGLISNLAWSMPKDHWSRNEFVSIVRSQALENLPQQSNSSATGSATLSFGKNTLSKEEQEILSNGIRLSGILDFFRKAYEAGIHSTDFDLLIHSLDLKLSGIHYPSERIKALTQKFSDLNLKKNTDQASADIAKKLIQDYNKQTTASNKKTWISGIENELRQVNRKVDLLISNYDSDTQSKQVQQNKLKRDYGFKESQISETTDEVERVVQLAKEMR